MIPQVTGNLTSVVKGMDKAMESMNLDRASCIILFRDALSYITSNLDLTCHGQI